MSGYVDFDKTGNEDVDSLLDTVHYAGKCYHHTSQWTDDTPPMYGQEGEYPLEWIQLKANKLADKLNGVHYLFTYEPPYGESIFKFSDTLSDEVIKTFLMSLPPFKDNIETESGYKFCDFLDSCTVEELMQERIWNGERTLLKIEDADCDNHWVYVREIERV